MSAVGMGYSAQIQSYGRLLREGALAFETVAVISDGYLNFGSPLGASGYGLRDNAGVVQYKNSGGAWQSFPTGGAAPDDATYLVQTADAGLPNAQAMGALSSGLVFSTTATGVQSTVASVATGQVLVSGGVGVAPAYSANPTVTSLTAATVRGSVATILTLSTDGKLTVMNSAASAGVLWDYTTNGLAKLFPTTGSPGALGNLQLGRGTAALKALRFVRGNDVEEATFGFHVDTVDANNLVFGISNVNRVVLSNAALLGIHIASDASFNFASTTNAASGTYDLRLTRSAASTLHVLGAAGADVGVVKASAFQTSTALVALGGGAAPTLGTIGGSGPATAGQNTWLRMVDSTGAAFWVPAWK